MTGTKRLLILLSIVLLGAGGTALAKYEQEQLALETQLQQRIEGILSKTLPPSSYLVTIKVEMEQKATPQVRNTQRKLAGNNPFLANSEFVLPGVPQKKEFVQPQDNTTNETVINGFSAETLVKKISISVLVAADVTAEQIRALREVISGSIPFNPLRGDEMDIQNSPLLKRVNPVTSPSAAFNNGAGAASSAPRSGGLFGGDRTSLPLVLVLSIILLIMVLGLVFLFGPVRAFLNRLLAVLPRIGEQAAYTVSNAPKTNTAGTLNGSVQGNVYQNDKPHNGNGNGDGVDLPFHFIREEHLTKLPILFRQMPAQQTALVLAYLAPEWASRIIGLLDSETQTSVLQELSQPQEVPPDVVKEIESQIKNKLPYLVGGTEWIQSVYQMTQPQTQRALLGTRTQQSPQLAQELRRKSFFYEDVTMLGPGALRLLVQEAGYPMFAASMKDEKPEIIDGLLRKLPTVTREIIQQELEMSVDDKAALADAKTRIVALARRLIIEGRLSMPEKK